jgi:hypothetical protein
MCTGCIIALHKQSGSSNREMHISEKYYNVNNDWRHVTLRHASLNRAKRVYRADQYIYKFLPLTVGPRSPSEQDEGGRFSRFVEIVADLPLPTDLPPTIIPLSGVGTTCFDKDSAIILRSVACLTSSLLETGMGANDCTCNRDQRLNVPSEARRSSR